MNPALRRLVVDRPGGRSASDVEWFHYEQKFTCLTTCYPVFRDRSRRALPDHCQVIAFLRFFLSGVSAVEGCCLYSVRFAASTVFRLFSLTPPPLPDPLRDSAWLAPGDRFPSGFPRFAFAFSREALSTRFGRRRQLVFRLFSVDPVSLPVLPALCLARAR